MEVVGLFLGFSRPHIITKRVHRLQNGESNVVLVVDQFNFLAHPIDGSVCDVEPVQGSKGVQQTENRNDTEINLPDQCRLIDAWVHLLDSDLPTGSELGGLPVNRESWGTRSWWRLNVSRVW